MSCFATLCPCCPTYQQNVPSLYDDDLGDLEFENLLQGHRTSHPHTSTTLWQKIAALFRRQQPIFLPPDDTLNSSYTNPAYRSLAPPDAGDDDVFLVDDMEEDVEVMSQEEIRHKIVTQASKV
jgi:hypothetical protein